MRSSAGGGPALDQANLPRSGLGAEHRQQGPGPDPRPARRQRPRSAEQAAPHARPLRVDHRGTAGSLSRVDRRAAARGTAAAGIPRWLFHDPPATQRTAGQVSTCPRGPI